MDRPAAANPATAREIILEIVRNMREDLEPLHYSTLPLAIFHVYLHTGDMKRLRGILPRIIDGARRALDAEVESLNRVSPGERLKLKARVGTQWELRGAVARRDLGRTPSHLSAIPPPRGRPGEGPIDSPFLVEYLDAERMLPVMVRKAA
jgi:hypothetical protein